MIPIRSRRLLPLLLALGVSATTAAQAQTAGIASGSWFQFDGLVFSISGCTYDGGSCAGDAAQMTASTTADGATIDFQSSAGGNLLSAAARATAPSLDFTLSVWSAAPGGTLSYAAANLSGSVSQSADSADLAQILATFDTYGNQYQVNASAGSQSVSASFSPVNFSASNPLSIDINLGLNTSAAVLGDTLNLHDVAMTFGPAVPEPATVGVFGLALLVVVLAHTRRPRPRRR